MPISARKKLTNIGFLIDSNSEKQFPSVLIKYDKYYNFHRLKLRKTACGMLANGTLSGLSSARTSFCPTILSLLTSSPEKYELRVRRQGFILVCKSVPKQRKEPKRQQPPQEQYYWKRKSNAASGTKAKELVNLILPLSNVKEEIYGVLDRWAAFEEEFPLIAVKKATKILRDREQWIRMIQVYKWMLSKGQGKTTWTYEMLLKALDMDYRVEEAEALWGSLINKYLESTPRMLFARMISMYKRHQMPEKALKVFMQMEELSIRPDAGILATIGKIYEQLGFLEKQQELQEKYRPSPNYDHFKGSKIRARPKSKSR